jgi:Protein of unknown function (DUF1236)
MKSKLLLSTAALVAGISLASAQDMPRGGGQPGGQSGGAAQSQGAPGAGGQDRQQSQSPQNRGGQAQQGMPDQGKQGQSPRNRETTGQAPQKEQGKQGQREEKGKEGQTQRGQRDRDQTTGQGQREQSPSAQGQRDQSPSREQGQTQQRQQGPAGGQAEQGRSGGSTVNLTTEQRTKIRETVLVGGNAPRVSNVNFSLRVGTVVPTSVRVVEVAPVLVEIHPEWRGYFYFVVGDEIIIVDRNHHIVAILAV